MLQFFFKMGHFDPKLLFLPLCFLPKDSHSHAQPFLSLPHLLPSLSFLHFIFIFFPKNASTLRRQQHGRPIATGEPLLVDDSLFPFLILLFPLLSLFLTSSILFYFFFHFILIFHSPIPKHFHYHSLILSKI